MYDSLGFLTATAIAAFGALIPEALRWIACFRANRVPRPLEWLASIILIALSGIGVALLFNTQGVLPLQIAIMGAAFPQTFSSAVAAFTAPTPTTRGKPARRRVIDYLGWRLA